MSERKDLKEERRKWVDQLIENKKERENTEAIVGLCCFFPIILFLLGLGIWGFIKVINWLVTLG